MTDSTSTTSTSNFPGQIQSTIIDKSYQSILTCLFNKEKHVKKHLSKMLPRLFSPPTPSWGTGLWEIP